jgi:hypothetical protein
MRMANMTISLPKELCEKMKRHPETKWSEVARKALSDYVDHLEMVEGGVIPAEKLYARLKERGLDVSTIDFDKAKEWYEEGRKQARKRLSTIQANL